MALQCQYDLEAHLGHIITCKYCMGFILHLLMGVFDLINYRGRKLLFEWIFLLNAIFILQ